jgi:hypothetical protein
MGITHMSLSNRLVGCGNGVVVLSLLFLLASFLSTGSSGRV